MLCRTEGNRRSRKAFSEETTNLEKAKEAQNDSQDLIIPGNESKAGC